MKKMLLGSFLLLCVFGSAVAFWGCGTSGDLPLAGDSQSTTKKAVVGKITMQPSGNPVASRHVPRGSFVASVASGSGVPVENAKVWVEELPGIFTFTNKDGEFFLENVPAHVARIVASCKISNDVFKMRSDEIALLTERPVEVALELRQAKCVIEGTVKLPDGTCPIPGTIATLWGEAFTIGEDGRFVTPPLPLLPGDSIINHITFEHPISKEQTRIPLSFLSENVPSNVEIVIPGSGEETREDNLSVLLVAKSGENATTVAQSREALQFFAIVSPTDTVLDQVTWTTTGGSFEEVPVSERHTTTRNWIAPSVGGQCIITMTIVNSRGKSAWYSLPIQVEGPQGFTLVYHGNGSTSGTVPVDRLYSPSSDIIVQTNSGSLQRTGCAFSCWNTLADGNGTDHHPGSTIKIGDASVNLYAKWLSIKCGVTFWGMHDSVLASQAVSYGEKISRPADPVQDGYTFSGWYKDAAFTQEMNFAESITSAVNIYSKWATNAFSITYNLNGGQNHANNPTTYTIETETISLQPATKSGSTFGGWFDNGTFTGSVITQIVKGSAGDLTLFAKWTIDTYAVTYNGNGHTSGTAPTSQTKTNNVSLTLAENTGTLAKTGYTFAGWNTKADGSGTDYAVSADYTGNEALTLFAKWTINTYTVTYNGNGHTSGTVPTSQTKTYDVTLALAGNTGTLAKTGYTFAGWNTKADGSGTDYAVSADYTTNEALTLYAKWTIDTYPVSYNANGATSGTAPTSQTKTHDVNLALAANSGSLVRDGYFLACWNTSPFGTGTSYEFSADFTGNENLTLYAKWTLHNTCTVKYDGNGNTGGTEPDDQLKTFDVPLTLAANSGNLLKTDFFFAGWNTRADGTGTNYAESADYAGNTSVTLYARWKENFRTVWDTRLANTGNAITLPLGGTVDVTIDWGDGSVEQINTIKPSHTYGAPGTYTVSVAGSASEFSSLSFGVSTQNRNLLVKVLQWGDLGFTKILGAFAYCSNIREVPTTLLTLSKVTSLDYMFMNAFSFNQDIGDWNTENITSMRCMFYLATSFNQNVGNWNTANVTDMASMFHSASAFNQDIGNWNTAKVTTMESMFQSATAFNQDISHWNTANVTNMRKIFDSAQSFNQNVGIWDTANVTNMSYVFQLAKSFNQDISGWNTAKVTDMSFMFSGAEKFNQNIGTWNTEKVVDMCNMFNIAKSFNQDIGSWNTGKVEDMSGMFGNAQSFNQDIGGWNTENVSAMPGLFSSAKSFNQDISSWNTAKVTSMASMFQAASAFNQDLSGWSPHISAKPTNFDTDATAWILPRPTWGNY